MENGGKNLYEQLHVKPSFEGIVGHVYSRVLQWYESDKYPEEQKVGITDKLRFGPQYRIKTSGDENMRVFSVTPDYFQKGSLYKNIILLAQNDNQELIGIRRVTLYDREDIIEAKGIVSSAERGKGLATGLEMVCMDILQREADAKGKPVTWKIEDENGPRLVDAEEAFHQVVGINKQVDIDALQEERARWQKLYGDEGVLGFTNGTKTFSPKESSNAIEEIDTIDLSIDKLEEGERVLYIPKIVSLTTFPDPQALRLIKMGEYQQNLVPKIKAIAAL